MAQGDGEMQGDMKMVKQPLLVTCLSLMTSFAACSDSSTTAGADASADARGQNTTDASPRPDATPAVLGCVVESIPDPIILTGSVKDLIGNSTASGMTLEVYPTGESEMAVSTVSDPDGNYSLSIPSGQSVWTGEIRAVHDDYIDMHIYPSGLTKHINPLDIPALTPEARELAGLLGGVTIEETDALVMAYVLDCNLDPIEGAVITTDLASGDVLYLLPDSPYLDSDAVSTSVSGTALILNGVASSSTPGKAVIHGEYGDRTWDVTVDVIPGELAIAIFLP